MSDYDPKSDLKKIKIVLPEVLSTGELTPPPDELLDMMEEAGWTDNPGTGKAVLLPDGSELLNPVPIAPPVDYDTAPSAFDLWQMNLQRMANIRDLGGGFLIDENDEEANDFDVDDPEDVFVRSDYELQMVPEAPALERSLETRSSGPVQAVSPEEAKREALKQSGDALAE